MEDSGWDGDRTTCGVAIGCSLGSVDEIQHTNNIYREQGYRKVSPYFLPKILVNMAGGYVSIIHGLKGPNHCVSTACATGAHALGDAASFIQRGLANAMLAGATEASINPVVMAGFCKAKALSTAFNDNPVQASRPFDANRDGFVIAEGSGVVMLEELELALKRGARIYAELRGYGLSGEAFHVTQPTPDGNAAKRCMAQALYTAGLETHHIDYINAHATSTPLGDLSEIRAIEDLFKDNIKEIIISSTKGSTGHLLAAAGVVEAIYSIMAINEGVIPPTINLEKLDDNINPTLNLPKLALKKPINVVLTNSFGFGGTNSTLIFSRL
jgi:3-oxoacyl-[acyl-carrier-protein] synthase II